MDSTSTSRFEVNRGGHLRDVKTGINRIHILVIGDVSLAEQPHPGHTHQHRAPQRSCMISTSLTPRNDSMWVSAGPRHTASLSGRVAVTHGDGDARRRPSPLHTFAQRGRRRTRFRVAGMLVFPVRTES